MLNYDLHSHSNCSDGLLAPAELVERAASCGVDALALTDHDTLAGLEQARATAHAAGMRLIDGVEISVSWNDTAIHILGLDVDPRCATLVEGLAKVRAGRVGRAQRIAEELRIFGIPNALEGAYRFCANHEMIGRSHFARCLVERGVVKDVKSVFQRFLVKGKPGYVAHQWAPLAEAVAWIVQSGGVAAVAHPGRYKISAAEMRILLAEFKASGGRAIEVVSSSHTPEQCARFAGYARELGLMASRGSDYHGPGESHILPGKIAPLPAGCEPVWEAFRQAAAKPC